MELHDLDKFVCLFVCLIDLGTNHKEMCYLQA